MPFRTLKLLFAACALGATASASTIFNFDSDTPGTSTTFTDTVNGLSATFSSSVDPGGFVVYPSIFDTLTGNVLGDPGPGGLDNLELDIAFSSNLDAVALDFATSDFSTPSPLTITAYENSQQVGFSQSVGSFISGFDFPEGEIAFEGAIFNRIVVSSGAVDFAIDNLAVVATPEPAVLPLLALGLVGIAIASWRARSGAEVARNN
jgi:hypothetical protein